MDPKETIKKNIERRSKFVDLVPLHKNFPMPTWVELSLIDVCNRKCSFCPKADDSVAPDTHQKMTRKIIDEIHDQLLEIHFSGTISLCGYGEPLLHKDISYIVKKLANVSKVEVITNGDVLSSKRLQELYLADVSKVLVSMYDGPEQIEKFKDMAKKANVPDDLMILRDRWYDQYNDFGVKLTNRAGTIKTGDQVKLDKYKTCYYPTYQLLVDWNGNVYLCPQDWQRKVSMGNIMQETIYQIWTGSSLTKYRKNLLSGKRCNSPCKECNADGTLLGKNHAKNWLTIYNQI
jgi:radical SAM protein with 4Fe4S-binding SPASM domain